MRTGAGILALVAAASASSYAPCGTTHDGIVVISTPTPYTSISAACGAFGLLPAEITNANFAAAASVAHACVGASLPAWVGSWYGIDYGPGACLALYAGSASGEGAIASPAPCTQSLPVVCMARRTLAPIPPSCVAGNYAAIPFVGLRDGQVQAACAAYGLVPAEVGDVASADVEAAVLGCYGGPEAPWVSPYLPTSYDAASIALWNGADMDPVLSFESAATVASYNYSVVCRVPSCPPFTQQIWATDLGESAAMEGQADTAEESAAIYCRVDDLQILPAFVPFDQAAQVCADAHMDFAYLTGAEVLSLAPLLNSASCAAQTYSAGHVPGAWVAGFSTPLFTQSCVQYAPQGVYYQTGAFCTASTAVFPALCQQPNGRHT